MCVNFTTACIAKSGGQRSDITSHFPCMSAVCTSKEGKTNKIAHQYTLKGKTCELRPGDAVREFERYGTGQRNPSR